MIYLNMHACMCLVAITDKHCCNFMDPTVLGPGKLATLFHFMQHPSFIKSHYHYQGQALKIIHCIFSDMRQQLV